MLIERDNIAEAWFELLDNLYRNGRPVSPRGFETRELLGVQIRVTDLRNNLLVHPARALSYRFAVAEWLWLAAGREDVATMAKYNKHITQFSDDGAKFAGAYGPRVALQLPYLMEQLRKPYSRQAVVTIWTPSPAPSKDIPCTISWQLFVRDGRLHGIVTMRSSDAWLGLPYDFHNFSQLTSGIAGELGLSTGMLVFQLGSSHLYDRDRDKANLVLSDERSLRCLRSPALPGSPPADAILNWDESLTEPWNVYRNVLQAQTNINALDHLEVLSATT